MARLTAATIHKLTKPGRHGDGGGLYLYIARGGSKSWVQRIRLAGRRVDRGLGGYPSVSLAEARRRAGANRASVQQGRDPWGGVEQERRIRLEHLARVPTFAEAARKLHADKVQAGELSSEKHAKNWIQMLEKHAFPEFAETPVDEITQREVKDFLERLGSRLTETAKRVRSRMRSIFDDCLEAEYITVNPAGDGIRLSVRRWSRTHKVKHFAALPYQDVPAALERMRHTQALRETRLSLQFLILTAARSGEVRGATWDEIDLDAKTWTIPEGRMKSDKSHRVPLSVQAVLLLREARDAVIKRKKRRPDYNPNGLIFPHPSGKPLSENALSLRVKKDGLGCTVHGFRSSFRDWAQEHSGASWAAIELSLAHKVGTSVEAAYFRSDLIDLRRDLMQRWADHCQDIRPF